MIRTETAAQYRLVVQRTTSSSSSSSSSSSATTSAASLAASSSAATTTSATSLASSMIFQSVAECLKSLTGETTNDPSFSQQQQQQQQQQRPRRRRVWATAKLAISDDELRRQVAGHGGFSRLNQRGSRGGWQTLARSLKLCGHPGRKPCSCGQNLKNRYLIVSGLVSGETSFDRTEMAKFPSGIGGLDNSIASSMHDDNDNGDINALEMEQRRAPGTAKEDGVVAVRIWQTLLPAASKVSSLPMNVSVPVDHCEIGPFLFSLSVSASRRPRDQRADAVASPPEPETGNRRLVRQFEWRILYGRRKLEYFFRHRGLGFKMYIPLDDIKAWSVRVSDYVLLLTLSKPPEFWEEVNEVSSKRYRRTEDFTGGYAFAYKIHAIKFLDNSFVRCLSELVSFQPELGSLPGVDLHSDCRYLAAATQYCENDGDALAMLYCVDCHQHLCHECSNILHRHPTKRAHLRRSITGVQKTRKMMAHPRCRCGTSGRRRDLQPSQVASCRRKRCPCFVENRPCAGCGCRNCQNPRNRDDRQDRVEAPPPPPVYISPLVGAPAATGAGAAASVAVVVADAMSLPLMTTRSLELASETSAAIAMTGTTGTRSEGGAGAAQGDFVGGGDDNDDAEDEGEEGGGDRAAPGHDRDGEAVVKLMNSFTNIGTMRAY